MFPYDAHYVLATDEEVEQLYDWGPGSTCLDSNSAPQRNLSI
jgi:hypothetical protein